jgi:hypothetical protein
MKLSYNIRYGSYVPGLRAESLSLTSLGMAGRVNCPTRSPERLLRGPVKGGMKMVAFALAIPVKTLLAFSIVELIPSSPILLIHFILYCIVNKKVYLFLFNCWVAFISLCILTCMCVFMCVLIWSSMIVWCVNG